MVLPNGINKASGLGAALEDLGLSAHNVVATGDAENDLAFMRTCGCAVAVGNALPAVKEAADLVTLGDAGRRGRRGRSRPGWPTSTRCSRPPSSATRFRSAPRVDDGNARSGSARPRQRADHRHLGRRQVDARDRSAGAACGSRFPTLPVRSRRRLRRLRRGRDLRGCRHAGRRPEPVLDAVRKLGTNVTINLLGSQRRRPAGHAGQPVPGRARHPRQIRPAALDPGRRGPPHAAARAGCRGRRQPRRPGRRPSSSPCIRTRWRPARSQHRHRAAHRPARASG